MVPAWAPSLRLAPSRSGRTRNESGCAAIGARSSGLGGANLVQLGVWRSLVARSVRVGEVPSSNLGTPILARGKPCFPRGPPSSRCGGALGEVVRLPACGQPHGGGDTGRARIPADTTAFGLGCGLGPRRSFRDRGRDPRQSEPPGSEANRAKKEGAHGGTMGSPVLIRRPRGRNGSRAGRARARTRARSRRAGSSGARGSRRRPPSARIRRGRARKSRRSRGW
jgi:hypothetical protein